MATEVDSDGRVLTTKCFIEDRLTPLVELLGFRVLALEGKGGGGWGKVMMRAASGYCA